MVRRRLPRADILWRNPTTEQVVTRFMNGCAPGGAGRDGSLAISRNKRRLPAFFDQSNCICLPAA
jgi:hypothetical protein